MTVRAPSTTAIPSRAFAAAVAFVAASLSGPAAVAAELSIITFPAAGDTYAAGEEIELKLDGFGADAYVVGTPAIRMQVGAEARDAPYVAGHATEGLLFRYVVAAGDLDSDGISVGTGPAAVVLPAGSSIRDVNATDLSLEFTAIPDQAGQRVDAVPPRATEATIVSDPQEGGSIRSWRDDSHRHPV